MPCLEHGNLTICVPTIDAWRRCFIRCPVCRTRRLCLGETQDWYGERWTCLTCGSGWMDGELKPAGKREGPKIAARSKARIKEYLANGLAPGFERYMEKLKREFEQKQV